MRLVAKTSFGLENLLVQELQSLGAENVVPGVRAVTFDGDLALMYKTNLWSRVALRVLRPVKKFPAASEQQLYDEIQKIDWSLFLTPDDTLAVDAVVNRSGMSHSLYVAQKTKDAIVDQFRNKTGRRPSVDLDRPTLRIHVHISSDEAEVSLDSSGESLHKRGYRQQTGDAPINESLAAGLILLSGWDQRSPFLDFMCGSGTIVIEAAMMALVVAPGLTRPEFGFERWSDFDKVLWESLLAEARSSIKTSLDFAISGVDLSSASIRFAKENAKAAGVGEQVQFINADFETHVPQGLPGVIVTNPPYGGRITSNDLLDLYKKMGDELKKKYTGWKAFIFTANQEAAKKIGLKPSARTPLFNGKLECRLLKFEMYEGTRKFKV